MAYYEQMAQEEVSQTRNNSSNGIRWGWIAAGLGVFALASFFMMKGSETAVQYYMTVGEYLDRKSSYQGKTIKIAGKVKTGTLSKSGTQHTFVVEDLGKELHVIFDGLVPDTFKEKSEVVVEGIATPDQIFVANNLMAKCASKYEVGGLPPLEQMRGRSKF